MIADRITQFHATSLKFDGRASLARRISAYVNGVRGRRAAPVREAQIVKYFAATDAEFVRQAINDALEQGTILIVRRSLSSGRRHNGAYLYVGVERAPQ